MYENNVVARGKNDFLDFNLIFIRSPDRNEIMKPRQGQIIFFRVSAMCVRILFSENSIYMLHEKHLSRVTIDCRRSREMQVLNWERQICEEIQRPRVPDVRCHVFVRREGR